MGGYEDFLKGLKLASPTHCELQKRFVCGGTTSVIS